MDWRHYFEETKAAWKKVLRPKVLLTTSIIILLFVGLYFLFLLYKLITADLTIMFWPNDVYAQDTNVSVSLRANNYLLCEATCTIALTKGDAVLQEYKNVTLRNNEFEASFLLPDPPRGEGKEVYVAHATCTSTGRTACYAREEPARENALIIHEYSLSREDERARQTLIEEHPVFIELLRSIDEILIKAEQIQEELLSPPHTLRAEQALLEELLIQDGLLRERVHNWTFQQPPLAQAQALNESSNDLLISLLEQLREENTRRETINDLAIDERIGYVLHNTTSERAWNNFLNDYERGIGHLLPLRYQALEEQARDTLREELTQQGHNITNTTFEEQWLMYCTNCTVELVNQTTLSLLQEPEHIISNIPTHLSLPEKQCPACTGERPVLFLHGHSMNERNDPEWQLGTFTQLTNKLSTNTSYINAGVMTPYSSTTPIPRGAWEDLPVLVRGTYYYDTYHAGGSYILSREPSESIDTYAIRVRELVNTIQERTGAQEIDVVAHSMGGLVVRRYAQLFGDSNINQIITIGTPHYGIEGRTSRMCPLFGANKQCQEMRADSAMIARINDPERQLNTPITSVVGYGCDTSGADGDGIITRTSASLSGSVIYEFEGSCEEDYYHSLIVRDERVTSLVQELLRN